MSTTFDDFKNAFEEAAKTACKKTKVMAKTAKITFEIEAQKGKISSIYEKIGEAVVTGSLGAGEHEEEIFKLIDEAKFEKEKLKELYEKKREAAGNGCCKTCGKEGKKGTYCQRCGEKI